MRIQFNEKNTIWLVSDKDPDGEDKKLTKGEVIKVKHIGKPDKNGIRLVQYDKSYMFYLGREDNVTILE